MATYTDRTRTNAPAGGVAGWSQPPAALDRRTHRPARRRGRSGTPWPARGLHLAGAGPEDQNRPPPVHAGHAAAGHAVQLLRHGTRPEPAYGRSCGPPTRGACDSFLAGSPCGLVPGGRKGTAADAGVLACNRRGAAGITAASRRRLGDDLPRPGIGHRADCTVGVRGPYRGFQIRDVDEAAAED